MTVHSDHHFQNQKVPSPTAQSTFLQQDFTEVHNSCSLLTDNLINALG